MCSDALRRVVLGCCVLSLAFMGACVRSVDESTPTGGTVEMRAAWQAIGRLPDWSGVWTMDAASAEAATGDSFGTDNGRVPLTPEYQALRATARAAHAQANMSTCLPAGPTAILQHGVLFEFLFTPGRVTMLFEDGEIRRIHTDGRKHLDLEQLSGSFMGDSIGRWEDDTLVVDTIGFPNGELWQNHGVRATRNTHLVERIFLNREGSIQIDATMTDPKIFVRPYQYTRTYQRSQFEIGEPMCAQNNRDTGTSIDLTPPPEE